MKEIDKFKNICVEKGLKATNQRWEIFRQLRVATDHPDAETLFARVRRRLPAVSLDTVYRTLELFEREGLASQVGTITDRKRFDGDPAPHPHVVCTVCGVILNAHDGAPPEALDAEEMPGFSRIDSAHIEFRGVCAACAD